MKIGIRADGGNTIGMGHIMRTLVLAKELSKKHDVFYICRVDKPLSDKYRMGIEKVKLQGFIVRTIRENDVLCDLKNIEADLLITDCYDVDEKYFEETKKIFNKTAYIDDVNKYYFDVDFLINQNSDAEDFQYKVNSNTKLLLGTKYLLLRDEFKSIPKKRINDKVCNIMITVGGADSYNITEKILNYINELDYNFHVVIGPSFEDVSFVENFKSDKIKFYYNANMCELMKKCDMAISACGSTLYELSACRVPTLGIIIADNQNGIANKLNDMGIIKNLGWYDKIRKEDLINNIDKLANDYTLRKSLSEKASKLVDGKGAEIIAKVLCEKI